MLNIKQNFCSRKWTWLAAWGHIASAIVVILTFGYVYPAWGLLITETGMLRQVKRRIKTAERSTYER